MRVTFDLVRFRVILGLFGAFVSNLTLNLKTQDNKVSYTGKVFKVLWGGG